MDRSKNSKVYENGTFEDTEPDVEGAFEEDDEYETVSFWSLYRYVAKTVGTRLAMVPSSWVGGHQILF
jgi:hypothetical protein